MNLRVGVLFVLLVIGLLSSHASAQLRVVNYNIAQLMGNEDALMEVFAALHEDDKPGFAVPVSVFLFQEVREADVDVVHTLLNESAPPGVGYLNGTYNSVNQDGVGGAQAMFYRVGMLFEVQSEYAAFHTGAGRLTDRWRLRLVGYDSQMARFFAYSSHLKAGDSPSDADLRLWGVQQIRNNAATLGPGQYILYTGDFNFYHNTEPGYLQWFAPGHGQAIDPLGTGSWAGPSPANAIKHTQSPRKMHMVDGLVGGGMDDRFDFQLHTGKFQDGMGLSRIPGTYRSFGNDGLKYDLAINDGDNFYYPNDVPRSNALADALHDASDHIPVIVEYQIPARMAATIAPTNFGTVIQGATIDITFNVTNNVNTAHVVTPLGADVLQFTATGSGAINGTAGGTAEALAGPTSGLLPLTASTLGSVTGTITFNSPNEAVQPPTLVRTTSGTVIAPSQPSFSSEDVAPSLTIEIELDPDTGDYTFEVPVYNFALGGPNGQASMNVTGVSGLAKGDSLAFLPPPPEVIDVGPGDSQTLVFVYDTSVDALGVHTFETVVTTTDEDLPGATASELSLTIVVGLGEAAACPGDLTGDGAVNVFDLLDLLAAWGACSDCGDCPEDLTGDCSVNVFDLLELLSQWGPCP